MLAAFTVLDPGDQRAASPYRRGDPLRHPADGAATIVNGRRCDMKDGDLILTPPMCWHGHINASDHRIIWFDAANMPLIRGVRRPFLRAGRPEEREFWQVDEGDEKPLGRVRPGGADARARRRHSPKYRYSGEATRRMLSESPPGADGARADPLHQSGDRRRGDADARLLRHALRKNVDDPAETRHLEHDLPGGVG